MLVEALLAASRHWSVELHFQKGLAGGSGTALAATKETATNPAVLNAFCLAIVAGESPPAFPGLKGHEPNLDAARKDARAIEAATRALKSVVPEAPAHVAESSYFKSAGKLLTGVRTTPAFSRSKNGTIQQAFSSSATASAARIGALTASRDWPDSLAHLRRKHERRRFRTALLT